MDHPYIEALTAAGIDITRLEHFDSQANVDEVEVDNLHGHVPSQDDELAEELQRAMTEFLDSEDTSAQAWARMLSGVLTPVLLIHLQEAGDEMFMRGLPAANEMDVQLAIKQTVVGADDIRRKLLIAKQASLVAAGLSLPGFLSLDRLVLVAKSLKQRSKDLLEQRLVKRAVRRDEDSEFGFTGRKRFYAPDSERHGKAHLQVRQFNEEFELPERRIGSRVLPAAKFKFARENPKQAAEWSNSKAKVQYEYLHKNGEVDWR